MVPGRAGVKCEHLLSKERASQPFILGAVLYIIHRTNVTSLGGEKKKKKKEGGGGGGKSPFCEEMAKLEVPINQSKPGSLRYCQQLQAKQKHTKTRLFSEIRWLAF